MKSRVYELTPFRMSVPAIARLSDGPLPVDQIRMGNGLSITGLRTLPCTAEDAAKDLFYRTRREDRFRPILLEFPELARRVSAQELAALLPRVQMLDAGSRITRTFRDPIRGVLEVEFQAL